MDATRVPEIPVRTHTIANGARAKVLPQNINRNHLLVKWESTDFYVAYQNEDPGVDLKFYTLVDTNYKGDFFGPDMIPQSNVWYYNGSGAEADFKIRTDDHSEVLERG